MKVIIASTNPVKIASTEQALCSVFSDVKITVEGINPGVELPAQPMSDAETKNCAIARVEAIHAKCADADLWVAIEGGVDLTDHGLTYPSGQQMDCTACVVIRDRENRWGEAWTAKFPIPAQTCNLILAGVEMGHANDQVFGLNNSKHDMGMTGLVTDGLIDRTAYYVHALIFALVPFKKADIYFAQGQ